MNKAVISVPFLYNKLQELQYRLEYEGKKNLIPGVQAAMEMILTLPYREIVEVKGEYPMDIEKYPDPNSAKEYASRHISDSIAAYLRDNHMIQFEEGVCPLGYMLTGQITVLGEQEMYYDKG
jgi:hypothetical protein